MGAARVVGGRYELIRPVGRGGMGEVWAGLDTRLDRRVAVKLLRPNALPAGVDTDALISRFVREARLTARLEHPGVPAVHDTGTDAGDLYLVMQLIEGADLADFQAENEPVPIGWVAAVGAQVAAVLRTAHAANLIHRDLKPRNVMITLDGHIKVLDFGLAVLRDGDGTRITRTAESLGTPAYMAPEQAMDGTFGPESDVYSLGCVLYELITGQPVFTANTPLALMHRHYAETPAPVATLRQDTGPELTELVDRMLAKQPTRRPPATEIYDRLATLIPTTPGPRDIPMDPTRPFRDRLPRREPEGRSDPTTTGPIPTPPHPSAPPHYPNWSYPGSPPTHPMPPVYTPPLPPRSGFLDGLKRAGDGILLVSSLVWTGYGLILLITGATATGLVGFGSGLLLVLAAAAVRKTRLRNPHLWTVGPLHDGTSRPASGAEVTAEVVLLAFGALLMITAVVDAVNAANRRPGAQPLDLVLAGFLFAAAFLVPGVIMSLRRLARAGTRRRQAALPRPSAGQWG